MYDEFLRLEQKFVYSTMIKILKMINQKKFSSNKNERFFRDIVNKLWRQFLELLPRRIVHLTSLLLHTSLFFVSLFC